ncbi:acyltransferase [Plantactinospora sp. KLBMP9567]|uniref:acyltransferase n=1 Tax=Plantactinospora sp. KLBMP9567 TaxID=3085900 RepID=UPI002981413C|nr:acyltransferase family protein [Plantactinospora sp. KLBMP9567]MDW5329353.1 acyltransferase family protein [Plantactinospora sp. KLBMP9567]
MPQHQDGQPAPPPTGQRPAREYGLDLLRVIAICGVVAIHVFGIIVGKDDLRGSTQWWIATAIDIGAIWAVPVFVMISGAFVLDPRAHRAGPAAFYRKRFARILPAMIVWHLVYLLLVRLIMRGEDLRPLLLGRMLLDSTVFTALYFLWLIAGLYVIAPVLAAFLADGGVLRARVTAAVALGWTTVAYMLPGLALLGGLSRPNILTSWNRWWPFVGFFLAGWALRKVVLSRRGTILALLAAAVLLLESVWQYGVAPSHRLLQMTFPVMANGALVMIAALLIFVAATSINARMRIGPRSAGLLVRLSDASFGVFLVHLLVFEVLRLLIPAVAEGRSLAVISGTYLVVLLTSFAISTGAARIPYLRTVF